MFVSVCNHPTCHDRNMPTNEGNVRTKPKTHGISICNAVGPKRIVKAFFFSETAANFQQHQISKFQQHSGYTVEIE